MAQPTPPELPPDDPAPYPTAQMARVASAMRELAHPAQIGPYVVLGLIGEGGMGTVYKAEQREPIRRVVAVKVIKLGMDTREVIARFESERQALAVMNHPNVARVLDAGATESGRPYFVMEYVQGLPITAHADRNQLTVRQRLELFVQACEAVQHAHQKAIIHRDLKPSNILVTEESGRATVKVIDFGVAKAIDQRLTEKTLFTESGQPLGTPEYMSPEQAEPAAVGVDTRSDVYSLGVVLYELLSGALPFDPRTLRSAGYAEIQRIIREVDPPRPSTRLSGLGAGAAEVARLRQTVLEQLSRQLRGELEWIPLKAMRKEPSQRYATAQALAEDVRNYLSDKPLQAGPESAGYRVAKFLRRNRAGVAVAGGMLGLLLAGVVATTWQAIRATRAEGLTRAEQARTLEQKAEADRRRAEAEQARAATEQVNRFLVDMIGSVDPGVAQGRPVLVRDVLDKAAAGIAAQLAGQPRVESPVRSALGRTYFALGLYAEAEPHLAAALEIDRRTLGEDDPATLTSLQAVGRLLRMRGDFEKARNIYADVLDRRRRVLGDAHSDTIGSINDMAVVLDRLGDVGAEAMYREALERFTAAVGPDDPETLRVTGNLGQLLERIGRYEESEKLLRASYEGRKKRLGEDHPDTIGISTRLAFVMKHRGAWDEAEAMMRDALARTQRIEGAEHPRALIATSGLALLLSEQRKYDEAVPMYRDLIERSRRVLGNDNIETLGIMQSAASALGNAGLIDESIALLQETYEALRRIRGPDFPGTIRASQNLCLMLRHRERWDEALPLAKDGFERLREPGRVQIAPRQRASFLASYGVVLTRLGRHDEAIGPLVIAREALRETGDRDWGALSWVLRSLVVSSEALGRADDTARWQTELEAARAATRPATVPSTGPAAIPATRPGT